MPETPLPNARHTSDPVATADTPVAKAVAALRAAADERAFPMQWIR